MKLLVLTVFACAAGVMAQVARHRPLGEIGANLGGKLGSGFGGGFGSAIDTVLSIPGSVLGIGNRPQHVVPSVPSGPYGPSRPGSRPGYGPNTRPMNDPGTRSGYGPGARTGSGPGGRYESGGRTGERYNERGGSTSGRQGYEGQGSGGEYEKGGTYAREKTVHEREQGKGFDAGRGSQGSGRGGSEGRSDSYGKGGASYGAGYESRDDRL